jgi:hypothetical protein
MAPDLQRLGEAVDVLGYAELVDPMLLGGGEVVVDVLLTEIVAGFARVVRPQVEVVVGEHAPKLPGVSAI